jgi:ABC-type polysaccharide transport system permease subunit
MFSSLFSPSLLHLSGGAGQMLWLQQESFVNHRVLNNDLWRGVGWTEIK